MPVPPPTPPPQDVRLLVLRRVIVLQAWLIVAGVLLLGLLAGVAIYFNARLATLEAQARSGVAPGETVLWTAPTPALGLDEAVAAVAAPPPTLPPPAPRSAPASPQTQPAGPSPLDLAVRSVLAELAALIAPGPDGQPVLSDPGAARRLAERLEALLSDPAAGAAPATAALSLSRVWAALGEPRRALPWAQRAVQRTPTGGSERLHLASVLGLLQDWPAAVEACRALLAPGVASTPRETAEGRLLLAQALRGLGQREPAGQVLGELVQQRSATSAPGGADRVPEALWASAAVELAEVHLDLGRFDAAATTARQAWQWGADEAAAVVLGEALVRGDRPAEAVAELAPAAAAATPPAKVLLFLGIGQVRSGDPNAGAATLERLTTQRPTFSLGWHWRGVAAVQRNQLAEARECLLRAVALQPDYAPSWETLGVAQLNGGQVAEAVESLQRAGELPDAGSNVGVLLALAYLRQNLPEAARAALQQASQRDPAVLQRAREIPALAGLLAPATQGR